jgi:hypothetical protein
MNQDSAIPAAITPTQMMQDQFSEFCAHLDGLAESLDALKNGPPDGNFKFEQMRDWIFCMKLAMTFYAEANQAVQAGTWFAATAVSASALEAILLAKCFLEKDRIKALPKWANLRRSHKADFGLLMRSMDLSKLLEIAELLSWFPSTGIPEIFLQTMRPYIDARTEADLTALFVATPNVGLVCANHMREYRNLLHPAVCLKEGRQPSANAGMTATFLFLIAISALMPQAPHS